MGTPHLPASTPPLYLPSPLPPPLTGGFMIESPKDFAARIYASMLQQGSSPGGSGSSNGGAAEAVDPEVL